ncbi:MAG: dTDP-4-dehydrorhamnose 3,5-epimerase [Candidatus Woesebacteria bacterium GW2011_GWA1_39_21]|uniref:dTDP-4-dehydrorhamnose 3,5-epimerase n=1 Tax=Candidatus Woesebacteria bacterium GW2011_GWA1_39_21 TaxID=1618550 RepID=A0A0G0QN46_9BACT|nr:MAG: dTDP-4-dehydrorhamnose 3,5-epimerase [Candidatus Woesebacteria bacterium GW2011_GWA1_39_21]
MVNKHHKLNPPNIPTELSPKALRTLKPVIHQETNSPKIKGVYYKQLIRHVDARGDLTELWSFPWSKNEPIAKKVEHVYFNTTHEGFIKGFHWHRRTYSQYTCVSGKMQVVLVDIRKDSPTRYNVDQFIIGTNNPAYLKIPPGVLKAWKSLEGDSVIVNLLTSYDMSDNFKIDPQSILKTIWRK